MKKFYVCSHCNSINYNTLSSMQNGLIVYEPCCKCGETTAVFGCISGTEYTHEELAEMIDNKKREIYRIMD